MTASSRAAAVSQVFLVASGTFCHSAANLALRSYRIMDRGCAHRPRRWASSSDRRLSAKSMLGPECRLWYGHTDGIRSFAAAFLKASKYSW